MTFTSYEPLMTEPNSHFLDLLASMSPYNLLDFHKLGAEQWIYFSILVFNFVAFLGINRIYSTVTPRYQSWGLRSTLLGSWRNYIALHLIIFLLSPKGSVAQYDFDTGDVFFLGIFIVSLITSFAFINMFWFRARAVAEARPGQKDRTFRWAWPLAPWMIIAICYCLDWIGDHNPIPFSSRHLPRMIVPPSPERMDFDFYLWIFLACEVFFGQMFSGFPTGRNYAFTIVPVVRTVIELIVCGSPAQFMSWWSFLLALFPTAVALSFVRGEVLYTLMKWLPRSCCGGLRAKASAWKRAEKQRYNTI